MFVRLRLAMRFAGVGLCLFLLCIFSIASPQDNSDESDDTERVYKASEVDQKAVIDHKAGLKNSPTGEGCEGRDHVRLRVVLHSSGRVTDVKVLKKAVCKSFEERAIEAARMTKFKPATKGGIAVSQYAILEYNYGG